MISFRVRAYLIAILFGSCVVAHAEVPAEWQPRVVGGGNARVAVAAPKDLRFAHLSWPKAVRAADGTIVLATMPATGWCDWATAPTNPTPGCRPRWIT